MALPKIDVPVYQIDLPLSKKHINFRPFLVKEQKNLLMAMEADDATTIEQNIRQVLNNCTITEGIDIDKLPIIDVEYYFLNLRARSVGEIVENKYKCNNEVDGKLCGNIMDANINILDIKVEKNDNFNDTVQITDTISVKLKLPDFSVVKEATKYDSATDMAFDMIAKSIDYIYDGEQYYYAHETEPNELVDFVEHLNQTQFEKLEAFFNNLPRLNKTINVKCKACGFDHKIDVEGLESFFG
jgi:hypothetical protein